MRITSLSRFILTACATAAFATSAFALELDAAKRSGLVGETQEGYIAPVQPTPERASTW